MINHYLNPHPAKKSHFHGLIDTAEISGHPQLGVKVMLKRVLGTKGHDWETWPFNEFFSLGYARLFSPVLEDLSMSCSVIMPLIVVNLSRTCSRLRM